MAGDSVFWLAADSAVTSEVNLANKRASLWGESSVQIEAVVLAAD